MEQLEKTIAILLGTGFISLMWWVISLKTQLKKLHNESINSDTDTTDKSLKVNMELLATTETLLGKVATMTQQVNTLSLELAEVTRELTTYKRQVADYIKSCTCGASKYLNG